MCSTSLLAFTEPSFTRSMNTRSGFMYSFTTCWKQPALEQENKCSN